MTVFEWVKANSTLNIGTFFEHLKNPSGEGGSGNVFLPIEHFDANFTTENFVANLDIITIVAELNIEEYTAELSTITYGANINMENYNVNEN